MADAKKIQCPQKIEGQRKEKIFSFNNGSFYKHMPKFRTNIAEALHLYFDLIFI